MKIYNVSVLLWFEAEDEEEAMRLAEDVLSNAVKSDYNPDSPMGGYDISEAEENRC